MNAFQAILSWVCIYFVGLSWFVSGGNLAIVASFAGLVVPLSAFLIYVVRDLRRK